MRAKVDPVHWFLAGKGDTRSSYCLEDVATEFQVRGLELDWTCVVWDGDLRHGPDGLSHNSFIGDRWTRIHMADRRAYLLNAYRVLPTRARQGTVIVVPSGMTVTRRGRRGSTIRSIGTFAGWGWRNWIVRHAERGVSASQTLAPARKTVLCP